MANTSRKGARAARELLKEFRLLGFRACAVQRSGQRIADDAKEHGIAGDLICFGADTGWPSVLVEVGSVTKPVRASFASLAESVREMPGFVPLVARRLRGGTWVFNTSPNDKSAELETALDGLLQ